MSDGPPLFSGDYGRLGGAPTAVSDLNLLWDATGHIVASASGPHDNPEPCYTLEQWRELGYDRHSIVAAPRFRDLAHFDFTLEPDSPALAIGFKPIDMSDVGPRPDGQCSH